MRKTLKTEIVIKEIKYLIDHAEPRYKDFLQRKIAEKFGIKKSELED